jgi:succinoglycan biosynthesis transport protein ExoP
MPNFSPAPIRRLPDNLPGESLLRDQGQYHPSGEVYLREYWRVLFKHRLLIAAVILGAFLLSLIYAFTATPRYTAASKIRISTYEPILSDTKVEDMLEQKSKEAVYLDTQIEELKSLSLADKILADPDLKSVLDSRRSAVTSNATNSKSEAGDNAASALDQITGYHFPVSSLQEYLGAINIRPVRRTSLVVIEATSDDPRLAALMANKHAATYIDWGRANRTQQQSRGLQYLRSQADELREKTGDLERELADYAEANSIVALNKDENITVQKMSQLNKMLTDATAKRIEAEKQWENASNDLSKRSAGYDDPSTQGMRSELAKLESEYGQLSAKFTSNYPKMIQLKAQIDGLKKSIEDQRLQVANGLKAKSLAAADEERNFKEELEQQKSQTFELSKRQVQYNVLNRELTSSRELLQNVLKQIKETSLAVESNASNVSVVDNAVVPAFPSYPRKKLVVLVGILIGLLAGVGLAFLLNYLDNTVRTPEALAEVINLPTLGVVPSFELEREIGTTKARRLPYDRSIISATIAW